TGSSISISVSDAGPFPSRTHALSALRRRRRGPGASAHRRVRWVPATAPESATSPRPSPPPGAERELPSSEDELMEFPLDQVLIQTINGIVTGMILALVASGLTLIFGIMDVVNFAHGELFMLGAYAGVLVLAATGNFWVALVGATLLIALLGAVIHVTTLRPLLGRD